MGLDLAAERIAATELPLLLSDPSAADLPEVQRLPPVQMATIGHPDGRLVNIPAAQRVERTVQIRLNNAVLEQQTVDDGWLVWPVEGPARIWSASAPRGEHSTRRSSSSKSWK